MSKSDKKNWQVMLLVLLVTGGLPALWLGSVPMTDENIRVPLRLTAQLAFALYLVVLIARPLQQLLRSDSTAALLRNRRLVGVAFATTMTSHLGLIVLRFTSQPEPDFMFGIGGAAVYAVFYLMLITSFDAPRKAISPKAWKFLHRTGLVLAAFIFGLPHSFEDLSDPDYLKYGIPFAIALLIRITAWQRSRQPGS